MIQSRKQQAAEKKVLSFLKAGHLESAGAVLCKYAPTLDIQAVNGLLENYREQAHMEKEKGEIRSANRLLRKAESLAAFRDDGSISVDIIPLVVLPEEYCGKILLVSVIGNCIHDRTCLRSGDDWHREILRGFEEEVEDYGFEHFQIIPRGGAFVRFNQGGFITISGSSDEFGVCDMEKAAHLIGDTFPHRSVRTAIRN